MFGYESIYKNRNISILVLDNNNTHNKYMKNMLISERFSPVEVHNSDKNIMSYVKNFTPDIILIGLKFNYKNNNIAKNIWLNFTIPIIFILDDDDNKKYKNVFLSEPYGFLSPKVDKKLAKAIIESVYYKHIHIETYVQEVIKRPKSFINLAYEYKFDTNNCHLYKDNKVITLTKNEEKLLGVMSEFPTAIAPFKIIYSCIYRDDLYDLGKLRTLLYRFRKKLDFNIFETIPNVGYKLKVDKR